MGSRILPLRRLFHTLLVIAGAALGLTAEQAAQPKGIDFNREIRPILSDNCFTCHGPDEKQRQADLRLDRPDGVFADRGGYRVIVPGRPAESRLYQRISAENRLARMPPPAANRTLAPQQVELIRRWIEQGAEYKPHWSFIPLEETPVPEVIEGKWPRNPIDRFILSRLEKEGLRPSPEAARETLIRRLSLDLTGLPPALEEIDAFLADRSEDAYDKLVGRLLASPRYGERMANDWLDLARYADTYGYQADVDRDMSPWRDWVIRAFNENLPYDQFITWQIAGDLLPHPTRDQILATAFNRLHRQTNEGGSVEEEFRVEYVSDRVATVGTAFLGLTLSCARCHDHKYDPISQKDFYRMSAFFNNIDESGLYSHFTRATPSPSLLLYGAGEEAKHKALLDKINAKERALAEVQRQAERRFVSLLASGSNAIAAPEPVSAFSFEEIKDGSTP